MYLSFASSGTVAGVVHLSADPRVLRDSGGIGPGADSLFSHLCGACGLAQVAGIPPWVGAG